MTLCCDSRTASLPYIADGAKDDLTVYEEINGNVRYWSPGEYVRPLSGPETLMAVGGIFDTMSTVQAIWIDSKKPFRENEIREAIYQVSRVVPQLQFRLSRRSFQLWFKRIENFVMDFQLLMGDPMKVYIEEMKATFDMWSGPLWRSRLVILDNKPKADDSRPFKAVFILTCQHCITDGTTNMIICQKFVSILNQIVTYSFQPEKPFPVAPPVDDILQKPPVTFLAKYFCQKFCSTLIKDFNNKSYFKGTLPIPKTKAGQTFLYSDQLTEKETEVFLSLCKKEKITVHSCIVMIANFALLKLVQSKTNYTLGQTAINVTHCVSLRRYYEQKYKNCTGCHISFMEQKCPLSLSEASDFWSLARRANENLRNNLEIHKLPLNVIPILHYASLIFPINSFLTKKGQYHKTDCHYTTTNMGNIEHLLPPPKEEDCFSISYLQRSACCEFAGTPFILTFQTFRRRFMISMDYFTQKMTHEVSAEYFKILTCYIRNLVNYGQILIPGNL